MTYYSWFKKLVNVLIELFFVFAIISTLYVFTSAFTGTLKIVVFIVIVILYILFVLLFKNKIKQLFIYLQNVLKNLSSRNMLIIISLTLIILKIIYTIFFNFDATQDGDIQLYNQIADQILTTGNFHTDAISHLFGVALHITLFKALRLPIHIGMFIVFSISTMINFSSFKNIIGKEKSFIVIMLYILMPSSMFLTFCPTHEIFLYMYLSIFIFSFNNFIKAEKTKNRIIWTILMIVSTILACFVNPSGYIIWVILALTIILSNVKRIKKTVIIFVLVISVLGTNMISKSFEINEQITTINTYTILIHGSNPESLGEQVDGYPLHQMREYIYENTLDFSDAGFVDAAKNVLINQYKYLLTHPINLIELVAHKFYILWSGNHYSIELANIYGAFGNIGFYAFLAISTLIYLFALTVGLVFAKKKEEEIYISNYKLALLGCFCVTMLSIVTNKYSLYVTLFIYLISFYRIDIDENK